jgi:hypothetical protein
MQRTMSRDEAEEALRPALIPMKVIPQIFPITLNGAYVLAKEGKIETRTIGRRRFALSEPLRQMLALDQAP